MSSSAVAYAVASAAAVACWSQLLLATAVPRMQDERAFWRSDFAARWLQVYDGVFAVVMLASNASVVRKVYGVWKLVTYGAAAGASAWSVGGAHVGSGGGGGSADSSGGGAGPDTQRELDLGLGIHVGMVAVFAVLAAWQLVMIRAWPGAYRRVRLPWALFGRALRAGSAVLAAVANRGALWTGIIEDAHAVAAESPVWAVCNLVLSWGGVILGMVHNLNLIVPLRWASLFQLLTTATLVYSFSGPFASAFRHPALWPGYSTVCGALTSWQAFLPRPRGGLQAAVLAERSAAAGAAPWEEPREWCLAHPQEVVVLCTVVLGAMLPLALVAVLERTMKLQYVRLQAVEAAAGHMHPDLDLGRGGEDREDRDRDLDLDPGLEQTSLETAADAAPSGAWAGLWEVVHTMALLLLVFAVDWLAADKGPPSPNQPKG